jgi:hypothetical protein
MSFRNGSTAVLAALAMLVTAAPAGATFTQEPGSPYTVGSEPNAVVATDFNADGRIDTAVANGASSNVSTLLRQPGGGFAQELGSPTPTGTGPSFMVSADFNADNRPDLAVSNFVTGNVTILLRQPGGGFAQELGSPIDIPSRASGIAAADFNGDGRPDLAVADWDAGNVVVLLRKAGGGFTTEGSSASTGGVHPRHLAVADFNGDGRPDLAATNNATASVAILLRKSGGGFEMEGATIPVGAFPQYIVATDFNGDGRPDLALTSSEPATVTVLLRAGAGFVGEGTPIFVGGVPTGLAVGDFNRDGRPDLAAANSGANRVTVLLRGAGAFTPDPSSPIPTGTGPAGLTVADFNADGLDDLAVSNAGALSLSVLLNTTVLPGPPAPAAAAGGGAPISAPTTPAPAKPQAAAIGKSKTQVDEKRKFALGLSNPNNFKVSGKLSLVSAKKLEVAGKRKKVTLGGKAFAIAAKKRATVTFTLTKANFELLRQLKSIQATVKIETRAEGRPPQNTTRTITLLFPT